MDDEPKTPEQELEELRKKLEDQVRANERITIERDAAQDLLRGIDASGERKFPSGVLRDSSGHADMNTLLEDANKNTKEGIEKEIADATKEILAKYSDEQMSEPATIRAIISEFGQRIGTTAYKRATANSIEVFQKAVDMKSRIDNMINDWRTKNPELANKESEDLVEFFLMRKVSVDPANRNKPLPVLLDLATELAKEHLERNKEEGRVEERENQNPVVPLTISPRRGSGAKGGKVITEEKPMTQEESAARYLEHRKKMTEKRAWSGRPSA